MSNILGATTQILDVLVPLSDADRTRVLRSVQAVVDLTVDEVGRAWDPHHWDVLRKVGDAQEPITEEKPPQAAPKGSELEVRILEAIRLGAAQPKTIAKTVGANSQSYPFRKALSKLLKSGAVTATGSCGGRTYRLGTTP